MAEQRGAGGAVLLNGRGVGIPYRNMECAAVLFSLAAAEFCTESRYFQSRGRTTAIFFAIEIRENISQPPNFALELFFTNVGRVKCVIEPRCLPKRYLFDQSHNIAARGLRKLQQ